MSQDSAQQNQEGAITQTVEDGPTGGRRTTQGNTEASVPLLDGEELLIDARPAWSAYTPQILLAAILLIGGIAGGGEAFVGSALLAGVILAYVWWQRKKLRYVVTDRRVMKLMGISSKSTNEAWMKDVRGLQTGASLIERLLGHGHITVSTDILSSAGSIPGLGMLGLQGMTFGGISNYNEVAEVIRQRQGETKMN